MDWAVQARYTLKLNGGLHMPKQLHKSFQDVQVRDLLRRYCKNEIGLRHLKTILKLGRSRIFTLLKRYRADPEVFSIEYRRKNAPHRIQPEIEKNILFELSLEKKMISNPQIKLSCYNYTYIRDRLRDHYGQDVSVPTIIKKAKAGGFYLPKRTKKAHTREVLTNYIGELIQHDSSHHLWAPLAGVKWYLITSLDDHSRYLLYADLVERETSWTHILALESLVLGWGIPFSFYTDSHSIFRFVQGRDSLWRTHHLFTDDTNPQWKQVVQDLGIEVRHALSPQAKGKIERPYGWLQDRLVRTCAREDVRTLDQGRQVLQAELDRYNNRQVHSTTGEIPAVRFHRAKKEKRSLFRDFFIPPPFRSTKDIFCLRLERTVDAYRKVTVRDLVFKLRGVNTHQRVQLRVVFRQEQKIAEIRFWHKEKYLGTQRAKLSDFDEVRF